MTDTQSTRSAEEIAEEICFRAVDIADRSEDAIFRADALADVRQKIINAIQLERTECYKVEKERDWLSLQYYDECRAPREDLLQQRAERAEALLEKAHASILMAIARAEAAEAETLEQARLNGMGSEREARLEARIKELEVLAVERDELNEAVHAARAVLKATSEDLVTDINYLIEERDQARAEIVSLKTQLKNHEKSAAMALQAEADAQAMREAGEKLAKAVRGHRCDDPVHYDSCKLCEALSAFREARNK